MSTTKLNSSDVVAIIKACGESGVDSFQMGNLKFTIGKFKPDTPQYVLEIPDKTQKDDEALFRESIDDLVITDPERWEKIQTGEEELNEEN
jgi:hypothetical protein